MNIAKAINLFFEHARLKVLRSLAIVLCILLSGCLARRDIYVDFSGSKDETPVLTSAITNVKFINNQLIVEGSNLNSIVKLKLQNTSNNLNEDFTIESVSSTQIIANANRSFHLATGLIFDLILSSASASATYPVSFDLPAMGALPGQVLKFNGTSWLPASLTSTQNFMGTYDVNTNTPDLSQLCTANDNGNYYVVTAPGTYLLNSYNVGDWIICNGTTFEKIGFNSTFLQSFNGRTGAVTPSNGDYTWSQITKTGSKLEDIADINITGRADGMALLWDQANAKWVVGVVNSTPSAGSITASQIAAGTISNSQISNSAAIDQSKINGLTTALASKEPTIAAGAATQYFRGDKTFQTLDTSVVAEGTNKYYTDAKVIAAPITGLGAGSNAPITGTDSVLGAFAKLQNQISSTIDFSQPGLQPIDASRLILSGANFALTTNASGLVTTSSVTTTELDYLIGASSNLQSQINAKQSTITKATTQDVSAIRIYGTNTTNYVELKSAALTSNHTLIFPDSNGTSGQVLTTDGAGHLTWTTVATGGGGGGGSTDTIAEGTNNLYFTDTRARSAAVADSISDAITNVAPSQNAVFDALALKQNITDLASSVRAIVLDGLSLATNTAITASDSILSAFGKIQKQVTDLDSIKLNKTGGTLSVGTISGVPTPTNADDVANKGYIDNALPTAGPWIKSGSDLSYSAGNVGIGLSNPTSPLHVKGAIVSESVSNSVAYINFGAGNTQASSTTATTINICGLKDGGNYTLILTGVTAESNVTINAYPNYVGPTSCSGTAIQMDLGAGDTTFITAGNTNIISFVYLASRNVVYGIPAVNYNY